MAGIRDAAGLSVGLDANRSVFCGFCKSSRRKPLQSLEIGYDKFVPQTTSLESDNTFVLDEVKPVFYFGFEITFDLFIFRYCGPEMCS